MKKLLSLLLALLMVFPACLAEESIGVIGGADGPTAIILAHSDDPRQIALDAGRRVNTTVSVTNLTGLATGNAMIDTAIQDLLKCISLEIGEQGDEYQFALRMNGGDVLTLGAAVAGEDVYFKSNLIGSTVVIGQGEAETLLTRLLDMLVLMGTCTQEQADAFKANLPGSIDEYAAELSGMVGGSATAEDLASLDFSAIENAIAPVLEKLAEAESFAVPTNCDPAARAYEITITAADIASIGKGYVQFIRDNPLLADAMADSCYTEEERAELWQMVKGMDLYEDESDFNADYPTMEETLIQMEQDMDELAQSDGLTIAAAICVDADDLPVYMVIDMTVQGASESLAQQAVTEAGLQAESGFMAGAQPIQMQLVYMRRQAENGVNHVINLFEDGTGLLTADFVTAEGRAAGALDILDEEGTIAAAIAFTVNWRGDNAASYFDAAFEVTMQSESAGADAESESVTLAIVSSTVRSGVDFAQDTAITLTAPGGSGTLAIRTESADPASSILSDDVVRPAEMDDAAFANWFVGVMNGLQSWLGAVLGLLPASVQNLVVSLMFGLGM